MWLICIAFSVNKIRYYTQVKVNYLKKKRVVNFLDSISRLTISFVDTFVFEEENGLDSFEKTKMCLIFNSFFMYLYYYFINYWQNTHTFVFVIYIFKRCFGFYQNDITTKNFYCHKKCNIFQFKMINFNININFNHLKRKTRDFTYKNVICLWLLSIFYFSSFF